MVLRIRALRGSTVCSLHTEGNQFLYNDYILCCLFLGQIHLFTLYRLDEEVDTTLMSVH